MDDTNKPSDRGDATRRALIEAALTEFSRSGYHAASNRDIALRAKANQALIAYHFGGKEGLYLAVFEFLSEQIQARLGPAIATIQTRLADLQGKSPLSHTEREECVSLVLMVIERLGALLVSDPMREIAQLIVREQQEPTHAFDILYDSFMRHSLGAITGLVRCIRPQDSREEAGISVAAIIGQVMVFRVARSTFMRHLGWNEIGPDQFAALMKRVRLNVRAILSAKE
jgi:TetR/AcrR family transcriptional regulator, regulator of cefoperazone and chloramphenicol sensitivity